MDFVDKKTSLDALRTAGEDEDEEDADAVEALADFLESTFDYYAPGSHGVSERVFLGELAAAYVAGYEHATARDARDVARAIERSGLQV